MSDLLSMSLDDIIKQRKSAKKKPIAKKEFTFRSRGGRGGRGGRGRPGRGRGTGMNRSPNRTVNRILPLRPFGNRGNRLTRAASNNVGRRGNRRFFNFAKQSYYRWNKIPSNKATTADFGQQGGLNQFKPFPFRRRQRIRKDFNSVQFTGQGQIKMAQKSVKRARFLLMKQGIRVFQNRIPQPPTRTGRIKVGRYGLLTTRHQNLVERQAIMQRKIERAKQMRERREQSLLNRGMAVRHKIRTPPAAARRLPREHSYQPHEPYSPLFPATSSRSALRKPRTDNWLPPPMIIENSTRRTQELSQVNRAVVQGSHTGLDPTIQRKIHYIQEQGRRNRGDHTGAMYDVEDDPSTFRPTILASRMSLSDRFKRFMN